MHGKEAVDETKRHASAPEERRHIDAKNAAQAQGRDQNRATQHCQPNGLEQQWVTHTDELAQLRVILLSCKSQDRPSHQSDEK